jgi:hypothetical protein
MSHGQIRTPVAIKLLNLFDLVAKKDVVACPSPATPLPAKSNSYQNPIICIIARTTLRTTFFALIRLMVELPP